MKSWTIREAKTALDWAKTSGTERCSIQELAAKLARSTIAIQQFLRREIPPGQRPWAEKPRWDDADLVALVNECELTQSRSANAVRKLLARRVPQCVSQDDTSMDERDTLSMSRVAADFGISRRQVYRLLATKQLRIHKGRIAESSYRKVIREHPELIAYSKLPRERREWLVINGYPDPRLKVKRPGTKGILD